MATRRWSINTVRRRLVELNRFAGWLVEVYRDPVAATGAPYGWRYGSTVTLRAGNAVTPLALPRSAIPVSDLLP